MTAPNEVINLHSYLASWTVLSRLLLRPPTQEDLDSVRTPGLLAAWPLGQDGFADGLSLLGESARDGEDAAAVRSDYLTLFVGPGHAVVSPYESVHRGEEGLVFDTETLQVRVWYSRFGLAAPKLNREPDDHVGLELEFLVHLGQLALTEPEEAERVHGFIGQFVAAHPAAWLPRFADLLTRHAATSFYRGVGHLLRGTIERTTVAFPPPAGDP